MDTSNLITFIAVAESGSFSLAAHRLHLTQPAVSKRIANLEQQLDTLLFDRIGREVSLTEAGKTLLPRAYTIVGELNDTRRALTNLKGEVSGSLKLATSHHIGLHRLPRVLRHFSRTYPQVRLDIHFLDSEIAYQEIMHGHAELGIVTLAPDTSYPLESVCVWDDPLEFAASPEHPLARENRQLSLTEIVPYPAIFPDTHTFTHGIVLKLFEKAGLTPDITMSTNYLETIRMMVSIGLAWSVLPRIMLDEQVVRLPVTEVRLSRQLGYIFHRERTLSNAAKAFMQILDNCSAYCLPEKN